MSRCRPGDLAVVISAANKTNLGRIVKVLALHDRTGPLVYAEGGAVWLTESASPMLWTLASKEYWFFQGPIPDGQLQPIRGAIAAENVRRTSALVW